MKLKLTNPFSWLLLSSAASLILSASSPVIGTAQSPRAFTIDNDPVPGSATVLEGSAIVSGSAPSNIRLTGGARLILAMGGAATIYRDRAVLSSGAIASSAAAGYQIEAGPLRIGTETESSNIRIALHGTSVTIASLDGSAEVRSVAGAIIARVLPGEALDFDAVPGPTVQMSGILRRKGAFYFLTDEITHVTFQLLGGTVAPLSGKRVTVSGRHAPGTPQAGASDIIDVVEASPATTPVQGGGAKPAAISSGISVRRVAIVGGAAGAATIAGFGAAGSFANDSVSR